VTRPPPHTASDFVGLGAHAAGASVAPTCPVRKAAAERGARERAARPGTVRALPAASGTGGGRAAPSVETRAMRARGGAGGSP